MSNKGKAYLLIVSACLLALASGESRAQLPVVTPHDLLPEEKVIVDSAEVVQWKVLWDAARQNALQGDFDKSVAQYKALLAQKSNLEEARWELARVMMYLKRWDEAAALLELLLESEPGRILYINALGKVMWEMAQYERAVALFKEVYEQNPADQTALAGLVEGLSKLDRKSEALPYLEQLSSQEPTNRGVRRYLAFLYYEQEDYTRARTHLTILARNEDAEPDVLYKTARTYEQLGLEGQASTYWERILARQPDNVEAHIFLARYYENAEQLDRSLSHFQAILKHRPEDIASYARIADSYDRTGEYEKAISYYEKYLEQYPDDLEIKQRLVNLTAEQDRRGLHPASSDRSFPTADITQVENLKQDIQRLEKAGRYQEAIPLYRQLIELAPQDNSIHEGMTRDLIAIREKDDKYSVEKYLSETAPENISIYRSMAELLNRMGRHEELLAVLLKIHASDPGDKITIEELAILYMEMGELHESRKYFAMFSEYDCRNVRCLEARAVLSEKLNLLEHALRYYEALLNRQPDRYDLRLRTINLAARLGLLDSAVFHAGYLQGMMSFKKDLEITVLLAEAYRESGYLVRAVERYEDILEGTATGADDRMDQLRSRSLLGFAESYKDLGLVYEAEQILRRALASEANRIPYLDALFHLALERGTLDDSEIWLQALDAEMQAKRMAGRQWKNELLQAEMYSAEGDYDLAIELCRLAEISLVNEGGAGPNSIARGESAPFYNIRMVLAENLMLAEKYYEAEELLLGMRKVFAEELELLVLLEHLYLSSGQEEKRNDIALQLRQYAGEDFGRQLSLVKLYRKHANLSGQSEAAEKAISMVPASLGPKYLLVEAKSKSGEDYAALELLEKFQNNYPENTRFLSQEAELLAKVGLYEESIAVSGIILEEDPGRLDIILLQARMLWEMNRWKDSVNLYESVLEPPVDELLEKRINDLTLTIDQPPSENSWWEVLTFSAEGPLSIPQLVMVAQHAVDFSESGQLINGVAASYFALYSWQERFSKELSVRKSVMRREYYHAANKLEKIIAEYGSDDFLLYDLAGLYSKLERLGDEAQLYRKLEAQNASFSGLADAVQRNNLKRRPRVFFSYNMLEDDGWGGYKAVRQEILKGGGWYFLDTSQELDLDFSLVDYESTDDEQELRGWRGILAYKNRMSQALSIYIGGGLHKLEENYDNTFLFDAELTGKIADEMRAVLSFKQDVVADTVASLKRNIKRRDHKIELMFDLFPRLLLGGYYDFIDYSDDNWTNNYTFWASYIFLPEPTLLKISYNYDFYDSREGQLPGEPSDDGFAPDDHPYWSPLNYWITKFSFYFKHQLSNDALARGVPSYYTIEYSLGYDSDDNDLHELRASLNLEIAKNYILGASFGFLDLDVYQHEEALLSLTYRW